VSNFLQNLAKRSAGFPLAAECRPTPLANAESYVGASEGLSEVTSEQTGVSHVEAPPAAPLQTLNSSVAPQVQRALPEQGGVSSVRPTVAEPRAVEPRPLSAQSPTTNPQPFESTGEVVSAKEVTPVFQAESGKGADVAESTPVDEITSRAEPARAQTPVSARPRPTITNPPATTSQREAQDSPAPGPSVLEINETTQNKLDLVVTNHSIRPAPADPPLSFQFPRVASQAPQPPATIPIEVRIGRVEVRGVPPVQAATQSAPRESPPVGFASYNRLRRYRY